MSSAKHLSLVGENTMRSSSSPAAEWGRYIFRKFFVPFIEFLCAFGTSAVMFNGDFARNRGFVFGVGVSPASNTTVNLPQSLVIQYDKVFVDSLKGNTPWIRVTSRRMLDEHSGNQLQLFMYQNLPDPNQTTPPPTAPEGTIQTGLTVAVVTNKSTIGNYADYANISTYALQTAIDPALEALGVQMAYRLARIVNIICQQEADFAATQDTKVLITKTAPATVATSDITAAAQSLAGINALPLENGFYGGVIHPFTIGDILTDKTNNSLVDVVKRAPEGLEKLRELPSPDGDEVPIIEWGGVHFHQSTFVHQSGTAPNIMLRTYIVAKDGVISVSFGAKENTQIGDGDYRNLNVWIRRLTEPSGYDPSRMIGGFASFSAMFVATIPPDPIMRLRCIDAVSAIS